MVSILRHPLGRALNLGRRTAWDHAAAWLLADPRCNTLDDTSLRHSLETAINRNLEIELLLTAVRKHLLLTAPTALQQPAVRAFVFSLIKQCALNGHVFFSTQEENDAVESLFSQLCSGALQPQANRIDRTFLLLALYRPLEEIVDALPMEVRDLDLPPEFVYYVRQHVAAEKEVHALTGNIHSYERIQDETSLKVSAQYEDYPYPKWDFFRLPSPGHGLEPMRGYFSASTLRALDGPIDVLIAGCGTGERAIQSAVGFPKANVLGIDLSRTSLAYAIRMARLWRVPNVRFEQLDILQVDRLLDCQFDMIECIGVLHHMADPMTGWRALVNCLKDGGFMSIHVYSKLARREVSDIRETVTHEGVDRDYIRCVRRELMVSNPALIDKLAARNDFFDIYRCKDLLFNVSEQHFTVPQLAAYLQKLRLEFHGFRTPPFVDNALWTRFPHGHSARDLAAWAVFEERNPDAFKSNDGYAFWCRKKLGAHASR